MAFQPPVNFLKQYKIRRRTFAKVHAKVRIFDLT